MDYLFKLYFNLNAYEFSVWYKLCQSNRICIMTAKIFRIYTGKNKNRLVIAECSLSHPLRSPQLAINSERKVTRILNNVKLYLRYNDA